MQAGAAWRALLLLLFLAGSGIASSHWTVQTVAFPDFRLAQDVIAELRTHGFDAYAEFTMQDDTQYARVRVGCFSSEAAAAAMAELLLAGFADAAVVQPYSAGSGASFCVRDDVGFIKPADWSIQEQDRQQIIFRVELAGAVGFVRMAGAEWRLLTEIEPAAPPSSAGSVRFYQAEGSPGALIRAEVAGSDRIICPGELMWQSGHTAVVERSTMIAACVVESPPRSAADGSN